VKSGEISHQIAHCILVLLSSLGVMRAIFSLQQDVELHCWTSFWRFTRGFLEKHVFEARLKPRQITVFIDSKFFIFCLITRKTLKRFRGADLNPFQLVGYFISSVPAY